MTRCFVFIIYDTAELMLGLSLSIVAGSSYTTALLIGTSLGHRVRGWGLREAHIKESVVLMRFRFCCASFSFDLNMWAYIYHRRLLDDRYLCLGILFLWSLRQMRVCMLLPVRCSVDRSVCDEMMTLAKYLLAVI